MTITPQHVAMAVGLISIAAMLVNLGVVLSVVDQLKSEARTSREDRDELWKAHNAHGERIAKLEGRFKD